MDERWLDATRFSAAATRPNHSAQVHAAGGDDPDARRRAPACGHSASGTERLPREDAAVPDCTARRTAWTSSTRESVNQDKPELAASGYIFVYEDIRGRYGSEGSS